MTLEGQSGKVAALKERVLSVAMVGQSGEEDPNGESKTVAFGEKS